MNNTFPMLSIDIEVKGLDFDKLEADFEKAVEDSMDQFAEAIDKEWRKIASEKLNTTKDMYLQGLKVEKSGPDTVTGTLTGFMPVALETGAQRYDLKPGLLQGKLGRVLPLGKSSGQAPKYVTMHTSSNGWWHPGFEERAFHKQVLEKITEEIAPKVFGEAFGRIKV